MIRQNPIGYYGKKLLILICSILLLSVLVFGLSRLAPGDPLVSYYGDRAEKMTPAEPGMGHGEAGIAGFHSGAVSPLAARGPAGQFWHLL